MRLLVILLIVVSACSTGVEKEQQAISDENNEIHFYTPDSIKIYGDLYESQKTDPVILLFHQGGSNARAEYGSIIPKLTEQGFNVLAIDQRVGGQIYGNFNRTVAEIHDNTFDNPYGYCDALNNLESALDYMINSGFSGDKILWGSSYSASLAIQLANKRQEDVLAVLAFSPASGKPLAKCRPEQYFESLKTHLLILRPPNEMNNENTIAQIDLANQHNHRTYVAKHGVHGSSMLIPERVGNNVDETWEVVNAFLYNVRNN